jgi:hypothetical protein
MAGPNVLEARLHPRDGGVVQEQLTLGEAADQRTIGNYGYRILNQILANNDVFVSLFHNPMASRDVPISL